MSDLTPPQPPLSSLKQKINPLCSSRKYPHLPLEGILSKLVSKFLHKLCEITPKKQFLWEPGQTNFKSFKFHKTGLKIKKSSGRLLVTNWRNIVTRCKFLVVSLYNVNDAAHNMGQSIRFDCLKISRTEVSINLEVNWLCVCDLAHFFMTKAKQGEMKCLF